MSIHVFICMYTCDSMCTCIYIYIERERERDEERETERERERERERALEACLRQLRGAPSALAETNVG